LREGRAIYHNIKLSPGQVDKKSLYFIRKSAGFAIPSEKNITRETRSSPTKTRSIGGRSTQPESVFSRRKKRRGKLIGGEQKHLGKEGPIRKELFDWAQGKSRMARKRGGCRGKVGKTLIHRKKFLGERKGEKWGDKIPLTGTNRETSPQIWDSEKFATTREGAEGFLQGYRQAQGRTDTELRKPRGDEKGSRGQGLSG